jgi:hypothetical protein
MGHGTVLYYSSNMYCNRQIKILKDLVEIVVDVAMGSCVQRKAEGNTS